MKKILLIIIIGIAGFVGWQHRGDLRMLVKNSQQLSELVHEGTLLDTLRNDIFAPPPLRFEGGFQNAFLTAPGVIAATNSQRITQGLSNLRENAQLDQAAALKVADMFADQYFEHESPAGKGPSDLARQAGYDYIIIGENLALGNFKNDTTLVEAWMNSPGHRENILNTRFQEIGVAVGRGVFNGQKVWLAVQEFGKPSTACPVVSSLLRQEIDQLRVELDVRERDLTAEKKRLDATRPTSDEESAKNNADVAEYNKKVRAYNDQLAQLRSLVNQYNEQVRAFNACVG